MGWVHFSGVDRPALAAVLAQRGIGVDHCAGRLPARPGVLLIGEPAGVATVRRHWGGPLAVLAAACGEAAEIAALGAGADEMLCTGMSDALLAARLAALLRRSSRAAPITVGALMIDPVERRVLRDGRAIDLLPREYHLLRYLADQAGRPVDRRELLRQVWGLQFDPGTNVVEVHVSRLRARLDRGFAEPMLLTAKGRGYFLATGTRHADLPIADPAPAR